MQEMKLNQEKIEAIGAWWDDPQVWAPAVDTSGGVAILLHRNMDAKIFYHDFDQEGRWAWIKLRSVGKEWAIVSIYAPTERSARKKNFEHLWDVLPDVDDVVISGDWNVVVDDANPLFHVDRAGKDFDALLNLITDLDLYDPYRLSNPTDPGYSWYSS